MANTQKNTRAVIAYCNRKGEIAFGTSVPRNAIALAWGDEARLRERISVLGRMAYDNETFLVPGVPEARSDEAATAAVREFQEWLQLELAAKEVA